MDVIKEFLTPACIGTVIIAIAVLNIITKFFEALNDNNRFQQNVIGRQMETMERDKVQNTQALQEMADKNLAIQREGLIALDNANKRNEDRNEKMFKGILNGVNEAHQKAIKAAYDANELVVNAQKSNADELLKIMDKQREDEHHRRTRGFLRSLW